jgi:hypothetical protein
VLNTIKLVEIFFQTILQLWALMIRCWLGFFKRVNRCVMACGSFCCCKATKSSRPHLAPSDTSGDETTDYEEIAKEPILVVINLDTVLVHTSSKKPKLMNPFDKPQQATTSLPFKVILKEGGNQEVYVHPRPELTRFI